MKINLIFTRKRSIENSSFQFQMTKWTRLLLDRIGFFNPSRIYKWYLLLCWGWKTFWFAAAAAAKCNHKDEDCRPSWFDPWVSALDISSLWLLLLAASLCKIEAENVGLESSLGLFSLLWFSSWSFRTCFFRSKFRQKPFWQMRQVKGFCSLCVCMWKVKLYIWKMKNLENDKDWARFSWEQRNIFGEILKMWLFFLDLWNYIFHILEFRGVFFVLNPLEFLQNSNKKF